MRAHCAMGFVLSLAAPLDAHAQAASLAAPPMSPCEASSWARFSSEEPTQSRAENVSELRVVRNLLAQLPGGDERRASTLYRLGLLQEEFARFLARDAEAHRGDISARRLEAQAAEARARVLKTWAYLAYRYPSYERTDEALARLVTILAGTGQTARAQAVYERLVARRGPRALRERAALGLRAGPRCTLDARRGAVR